VLYIPSGLRGSEAKARNGAVDMRRKKRTGTKAEEEAIGTQPGTMGSSGRPRGGEEEAKERKSEIEPRRRGGKDWSGPCFISCHGTKLPLAGNVMWEGWWVIWSACHSAHRHFAVTEK
jgi:hypothetical protein